MWRVYSKRSSLNSQSETSTGLSVEGCRGDVIKQVLLLLSSVCEAERDLNTSYCGLHASFRQQQQQHLFALLWQSSLGFLFLSTITHRAGPDVSQAPSLWLHTKSHLSMGAAKSPPRLSAAERAVVKASFWPGQKTTTHKTWISVIITLFPTAFPRRANDLLCVYERYTKNLHSLFTSKSIFFSYLAFCLHLAAEEDEEGLQLESNWGRYNYMLCFLDR